MPLFLFIFFSPSGFSVCSFFSFFLPLLPSFLLFTATYFYITYYCGIYHFCPSTAFGSLWVSFQDCPLACQLPSQYHCSECVGCTTLHSQTKLLVLFPTSLCFFTSLIWIRIKPLYYLPLWYASSGSNPHLPFFG